MFWKSSSLLDDSCALNSLLLSHSYSYTSQRPLPPQSLLDLILDECAWSSSEWMVDQRSTVLLWNINVSHQVLKITIALKWASESLNVRRCRWSFGEHRVCLRRFNNPGPWLSETCVCSRSSGLVVTVSALCRSQSYDDDSDVWWWLCPVFLSLSITNVHYMSKSLWTPKHQTCMLKNRFSRFNPSLLL